MSVYHIYTDGGCRNHGTQAGQHVRPSDPSAFAYLIIDEANGKTVCGTQASRGLTNNQEELAAVIHALQRLRRMMPAGYVFTGRFRLYADSRYVDNAINLGRLKKWAKQGYHKSPHGTKLIKNAGEWRALYRILPSFRRLSFHWVKGHDKSAGNIFVDHLLNGAMDVQTARHQQR